MYANEGGSKGKVDRKENSENRCDGHNRKENPEEDPGGDNRKEEVGNKEENRKDRFNQATSDDSDPSTRAY